MVGQGRCVVWTFDSIGSQRCSEPATALALASTNSKLDNDNEEQDGEEHEDGDFEDVGIWVSTCTYPVPHSRWLLLVFHHYPQLLQIMLVVSDVCQLHRNLMPNTHLLFPDLRTSDVMAHIDNEICLISLLNISTFFLTFRKLGF